MLILENIKWKNLLSTGDLFTEIPLNKHGTVLISGPNGSGKSTLMDAVCFALFNKPFRKINKPQLVNTINNKNLLVEIAFSTNGSKYKVIRGMKPTVFEIYCDDVLIDQSADSRDYQEVLEKTILKMTYKTFCQIAVLGQANFTAFMQLPAASRRAIIDNILDVEVLSTMSNLLKTKVVETKLKADDLDHQILLLKRQIELKTKHIGDIKKRNEIWRKSLEDQIFNKKKECVQLDLEHLKMMETIDDTLSSKYTKLISKRHQFESTITSLTNQISMLKKELTFYEKNDACPTCTQTIDESFKQTKIDDKNNVLDETDKKLKTIQDYLNKVNVHIDDLQEKIKHQDVLSRNAEKIKMEMSVIKASIKSLQENLKNSNSEDLSIKEEELSDDEDELVDLQSQRNLLDEDLSLYTDASTLLKDTGIKASIVSQYIPVINTTINEYLDQMDFFCNFEIDENFNETIKSLHRDTFTYESFSQGEKMRLDLAMLFTWREIARRRNSASVNLLILDEIMDSSLDYDGTDEFIKIIRQLAKNNNVFIISHKGDQMQDRFDHSFVFEKERNFSRLVND